MGQDGGASTITQQLAKMLFTKRASKNIVKRVLQKAKEWIVAIKLERQYTKKEIIAMYLNNKGFYLMPSEFVQPPEFTLEKKPKN